jgi:hypothetical protein
MGFFCLLSVHFIINFVLGFGAAAVGFFDDGDFMKVLEVPLQIALIREESRASVTLEGLDRCPFLVPWNFVH